MEKVISETGMKMLCHNLFWDDDREEYQCEATPSQIQDVNAAIFDLCEIKVKSTRTVCPYPHVGFKPMWCPNGGE